ncbi:MAG TPA: RNA-binding protein [Verrucomicrobiae bacterium]|jgi:cold-inducible RNA-binding protein|nr:RNA-binding protein [Verrucomicrobiae bacterium]
MNPTRLFVGNLSYQTGENDLQDYFAQAGAVTSVNLMLDKMTGKSRGFAFVEYASAEEAQKAIDQFHNKEFQGRPITVNVARPREERPARFGGGGGNRDSRGERSDYRGERRDRR